MEFSEQVMETKDVPPEVAAEQVGVVRLAARSVLAGAIQKVAAGDHLPAAEKQTLSALLGTLTPTEDKAATDAKFHLTKTRPRPIPRGMGNRRDTP